MKRNFVLFTLLLSLTSQIGAFHLLTKDEIKKELSKRCTKDKMIKVGAAIGVLCVAGGSYGLYRYFSRPVADISIPRITVTPPPSPRTCRLNLSADASPKAARRKSMTPPASPKRRKKNKGDTVNLSKSQG